MIKTTRIGSTLVCIINNKIYQKIVSNDDELLELYGRIGNTDETNQMEVFALVELFQPPKTNQEIEQQIKLAKLEEEAKEQQDLLDWLKELKIRTASHFSIEGNKFYVKGINITVPEFLIEEFRKRDGNEEDTNSLINFWRLLALNNDPRCRENLFTFLSKHELSITPSGYFVAYRNVNVKEEGNKELNDFITNSWLQVKKWKKAVKDYNIVNIEGVLTLVHWSKTETDLLNIIIGNLADLYNNMTNESDTVYTDKHTGKFEIKLGQMVSMPKEEADHSQDNECSRGLHVASSTWLSRNYYGSQGIVCLVNPMHVVSVPYADAGKLRCYKYLPIALAEYDNNNRIIPIDTKTFEYDFCENTKEEIEQMLNSTNLEELKEHEIIPKEIDIQSLKNILQGTKITMEEMNTVISNKVIKVND